MTTSWHAGRLTDSQAVRVESWIGVPEPVADLSWHQTDTTVLHVRAGGQNLIVKAGGSVNRHIGREITAHRGFTASLVEAGRAARLVAADPESHVLVLTFLPGVLVEGSPVELDPDIHEQAGRMLQTFHGGGSRIDETFEEIATARTLATLLLPHRIAPAQVAAAQRVLRAYRPGPVTVVPTHGDWQPRNWLTDGGTVRVIDFGRFEHRPAATDLCRLAVQQWRTAPELEAAFLRGHGVDPRDDTRWPVMLLREAIGTAVWAYQVGDEPFERQGHRMLTTALARLGGRKPLRAGRNGYRRGTRPRGTTVMSDDLKKGDHVEWSTHGTTTEGTVKEKITEETEAGGRKVKASEDEPQYLVESDKSGKDAVHKPDALDKA